MLESIKAFFSSFFNSKRVMMSQKELINTVSKEILSIKTVTIDMVDGLLNDIPSKDLDADKFLIALHSGMLDKKVSNTQYLNMIRDVLSDIVLHEGDIVKLIKATVPNTVVDKTVTVKELSVCHLVDNITYINNFCIDLCTFIITTISGVELNKKVRERIINSSIAFAKIINEYKRPRLKNIISSIPKASASSVQELVSVPEGISTAILNDTNKNADIGMVTAAFSGNPIYHLRLVMADWDQKKYDATQAKKALFDNIILDLKLQAQNNFDPKLEGQIKWYEAEVNKLEYEMSKYEASLH